MTNLQDGLSASVYPFYEAAAGCAGAVVTTAPMAEVVQRILAEGLGVELWAGEYDYRPFTPEAAAALARVCRGAARPVAVHTRVETWDPPALAREIALASRLGAGVLVVHGGTLGLKDGKGDWSAVRDLAARAKAAGPLLALENSGKIGIGPLRRALDALGDDPRASGLGLCIDVGHAHRSARLDGVPPEAFLAELARAVVEVHVHDNFGDEDLHLPPGQGTIDWAAVVPAILGLPGRTTVCLEVKCTGRPLETIRAARDFLARQAAGGAGSGRGGGAA